MKRNLLFVLLVLAMLCFSGCTQKNMESKAKTELTDDNEYKIYCLNKEGTKLAYSVYKAQSETPEELAYELLGQMYADTESLDCQCALKKPIEVLNVKINMNHMYVYFNKAYYDMDSVKEILVRAAVVKTLDQIDSVDVVMFYVDGKAQENKNGVMVGSMKASDFIDDVGGDLSSYKKTNIKLYFTDEQGMSLYVENREVFIDEMSSLEKIVLEQLLIGPEQENLKAVLPEGVTVISAVTRDGTCYVNLDDTFLTGSINAVETIPVYAIVNSLTEVTGVDRVQILIKGEIGKVYRGAIRFDSPLEEREDLIAVPE